MSQMETPNGLEAADALADANTSEIYQSASGGVRRNKQAPLSAFKAFFQKFASFTTGNLFKANSVGNPVDSGIDATVLSAAILDYGNRIPVNEADIAALEALQPTETTDAVTFASLDTGQGANELYDMDQDVKKASSVEFADIKTDTIAEKTARTGVSIQAVSGEQVKTKIITGSTSGSSSYAIAHGVSTGIRGFVVNGIEDVTQTHYDNTNVNWSADTSGGINTPQDYTIIVWYV